VLIPAAYPLFSCPPLLLTSHFSSSLQTRLSSPRLRSARCARRSPLIPSSFGCNAWIETRRCSILSGSAWIDFTCFPHRQRHGLPLFSLPQIRLSLLLLADAVGPAKLQVRRSAQRSSILAPSLRPCAATPSSRRHESGPRPPRLGFRGWLGFAPPRIVPPPPARQEGQRRLCNSPTS
jgi:hypothetical protein